MKKRILSMLLILCILTAFVPCAMGAEEKKYGEWLYYKVNENGDGVTITKCDSGASGNIVIPEKIDELPVASIGNSAFQGCSLITNITLPSRLTNIGDYAFFSCTSLSKVDIPDSVTNVGKCAFMSSGNLNIVVAENNPNYCDIDGVLFNKNKTEIIAYAKDKIQPNYTIPDSVNSFGYRAFSYCSFLNSVTIPVGVTNIKYDTFIQCGSLNIKVAENNPQYSAVDGVLYSKDKSEVIIYAKDKIQPNYIIPNGTTSIGDEAFMYCHNLMSVVIPNSVTHIGVGAFQNCISLVDIQLPDSITDISKSVFSDCESITNITIPYGVTSIGDNAFSNCSSLTNIVIPDSMTSIGGNAFSDCYSLKNIVIPENVSNIDNEFVGCGSLNIHVSLNNPNYCDIDGVLFNKDKTEIIAYAKDKIQPNYMIPDGIQSIHFAAFYSCTSLNSVAMPATVTSIAHQAFSYCTSLTDVYYGESKTEWENIEIDDLGNDPLLNATIHYGRYDPIAPATLTVTPSGNAYTLTAETDYDGEAYAAAYDAEGALISVVSEPFADGTATVAPDTAGAAKIKFFVWTNAVQPVTLTEEITLN